MNTRLPEYDDPPVVEVAVSLQFRPLEKLRSPHFGLLWPAFRADGYSRIEEHGEIEPAFEDFDSSMVPKVGIRVQTFDDAPPPPRVWFLNEREDELIQLQRDRLIVNWRKGAQSEPYPRYVNIIKRFRASLDSLIDFVRSEDLGDVIPTQCEITYVNHLPSSVGWSDHAQLDRVVTTWQNRYSDEFLPAPEDVAFKARFRMGKADLPGRLHVSLQPAFRAMDNQPIFVLNLIGRGRPEPADLGTVFRLFDDEHEWIVRGFTSITTTQMHELWRQENG